MATSLQQGAVFKDPDGHLDGVVMFFEGEIKDSKGIAAGKRLFALYTSRDSKDVRLMNPAFIWDLVDGDQSSAIQHYTTEILDGLKIAAMSRLIPMLEEYRTELSKERERQASIKEKYGVKSLEYLIVKLDGELIRLYERREKGENVDLVIRNKEEQKKNYEHSLKELTLNILQARMLTMSMPRFVGSICIVPEARVNPAMRSDEEIEKIGMEVAMQYERDHNRVPEDVAAQSLGFDIRSTDVNGSNRYIEVKARAAEAAVALTQNEWFKAKRFANEHFLYVVMNAATSPALFTIQNPAGRLQPEEKVELIRYIISVSDIHAKGIAAS